MMNLIILTTINGKLSERGSSWFAKPMVPERGWQAGCQLSANFMELIFFILLVLYLLCGLACFGWIMNTLYKTDDIKKDDITDIIVGLIVCLTLWPLIFCLDRSMKKL